MPASELEQIRSRLTESTGGLAAHIFDHLAPELVCHSNGNSSQRSERVVNDPIWKIFSLGPSVIPLVEMPLMQRLRRVRQLGLVHLVYPGAHHSRFEHSLGAMCAANEMFRSLADTSGMSADDSRRIKNILLAAAVLHDVGHTAFSHVGERVLQRALRDEFSAVQSVLQDAFPDDLAKRPSSGTSTASNQKAKLPPAAELVSALFVLSPAFEKAVGALKLEEQPHESVMMICGLILGRPKNLKIGDTYFHCFKGIISGDLDCDKIDYVARDAYYAGIPTATDIDRLLSQLVAVEARQDTVAPDLNYAFGGGNAAAIRLFGMRPSGTSALEMFVMTRSYLFERLYAHPKVRAAERYLERLLAQRIQFGRDSQAWGLKEIFALLYASGGDDFILGTLANEVTLPDAGDHFSSMARDILYRRLPARALAISRATMAETTVQGASLNTAGFMPWQDAEDELSQSTINFEARICELSELRVGGDVIVDWYLPNPIREDPDIWVSDPADDSTVKRVSSYFNVEQLSNAYRSTKQVAWVFANSVNVAKVAAAGAIALHESYDLLVDREAFNRAKVRMRLMTPFFNTLKERNDPRLNVIIGNIEANAGDKRLMAPPAKGLARALGILEESDRHFISEKLAQKLRDAQVPRSFYDHFYVASQVLTILLKHCEAYYRDREFSTAIKRGNEKRFHKHLQKFCVTDERCNSLFSVRSAEEAAGGEVDLVFSLKSKDQRYPDVVVELKSGQDDFGRQYAAHAGQPFQYTGKGYGRFSILYVQFASSSSVRLADTLDLRLNAHKGSKQLVFCLGQQAFAKVPSAGGKTSAAVGDDLGSRGRSHTKKHG